MRFFRHPTNPIDLVYPHFDHSLFLGFAVWCLSSAAKATLVLDLSNAEWRALENELPALLDYTKEEVILFLANRAAFKDEFPC